MWMAAGRHAMVALEGTLSFSGEPAPQGAASCNAVGDGTLAHERGT